jgi:heme/copper-type cytochrome/quinol oxidase subunit 1
MTAHEEDVEVAPVGEEIHMPSSSGIPIINAAGLALAIVSITISIVGVILGAAIFLLTAIIWIRDARREFEELPLEHPH